MSNRKPISEFIHHLIMGVLLILKGYEKYHHHELIGGLILSFGIILILYFVYGLIRKKKGPVLSFLVHFFEGVTLFLTTYIFYNEGKIYLPYVTFLAGVGFIVSLVGILEKKEKH